MAAMNRADRPVSHLSCRGMAAHQADRPQQIRDRGVIEGERLQLSARILGPHLAWWSDGGWRVESLGELRRRGEEWMDLDL